MSALTPLRKACERRIVDIDDFSILDERDHLHYLDSAATTQKPIQVIEAQGRVYRELNANVHRGVHWLSQETTEDRKSVV